MVQAIQTVSIRHKSSCRTRLCEDTAERDRVRVRTLDERDGVTVLTLQAAGRRWRRRLSDALNRRGASSWRVRRVCKPENLMQETCQLACRQARSPCIGFSGLSAAHKHAAWSTISGNACAQACRRAGGRTGTATPKTRCKVVLTYARPQRHVRRHCQEFAATCCRGEGHS